MSKADFMGQDNSTNQPNKPAFRQDLCSHQIVSLLTLLLSGLFLLNFDISIWQIIITIGTAQPTQYAGTGISTCRFLIPTVPSTFLKT